MADGFRRDLGRRLPGIGWREERLAERADQVASLREEVRALQAAHDELREGHDQLREERDRLRADQEQQRADLTERDAQLKELQSSLARASFRRELLDLRRTVVSLRDVDPDLRHPLRHLPFKLRNYRLAASHGVATPELLGVWGEAAQIDLAALPEQFVLKADGGSSGRGVLPLRRIAGDRYALLDGTRELTGTEMRDQWGTTSSISGPFFAEEVLTQRGGLPLPDDVKVYAAYGTVLQVLLRRMPEHGNLTTAGYRYLDADLQDLGEVNAGQRIDPDIPIPEQVPEMVRQAAHLSRAVGLPFCRVDLYDTDRGVVLGEITRAPGGRQQIRPDHDERMGLAWERARWELDRDLLAGRPLGILHGTHEAPNPYPEGHPSTAPDPGPWAIRTLPCEQWCHPPAGA